MIRSLAGAQFAKCLLEAKIYAMTLEKGDFMKALKSILMFTSLGGLLALNTACNNFEVAASAGLASQAIMCFAWCRQALPPPPAAVIYVAPIYAPAPIFVPAPVIIVPMQRRPVCGPFGCALNDLGTSPSELVALGEQNYGINGPAMEKLIKSFESAQKGDLKTAALNMGLNATILKEAQEGTISKGSADQIATAIGATPESVEAFVGDLNKSIQDKNLLKPKFDTCENCG